MVADGGPLASTWGHSSPEVKSALGSCSDTGSLQDKLSTAHSCTRAPGTLKGPDAGEACSLEGLLSYDGLFPLPHPQESESNGFRIPVKCTCSMSRCKGGLFQQAFSVVSQGWGTLSHGRSAG